MANGSEAVPLGGLSQLERELLSKLLQYVCNRNTYTLYQNFFLDLLGVNGTQSAAHQS